MQNKPRQRFPDNNMQQQQQQQPYRHQGGGYQGGGVPRMRHSAPQQPIQQQQQQQQQQQHNPQAQRTVYQYQPQPLSQATGQMPMLVGYAGGQNQYAQQILIPQIHTRQQYVNMPAGQMYTLPYGVQYPQPFYTNVAHAQPGLPVHAGGAQPLHYHQYQHQGNPTTSSQMYSGANLMAATNLQQIKPQQQPNPQQSSVQQHGVGGPQQQHPSQGGGALHPQQPQQQQPPQQHAPSQVVTSTSAIVTQPPQQQQPPVPPASSVPQPVPPKTREKRILKFVNPDTGENVKLSDESPPPKSPPPSSSTPSAEPVPVEVQGGGDQVVTASSEPEKAAATPTVEEESVQQPRTSPPDHKARTEFFQKITQASEDEGGPKGTDENPPSEFSTDLKEMEDDKQLYSPVSNGSLNQEDLNSPEKLAESLEKVSLEDKVGEAKEQVPVPAAATTITAPPPPPVLSTHESLDTSESLKTGETTPSEIEEPLAPPIVNDVDAGPSKVEQNIMQEKVNDGGHDHTLEEISMDEKDSPDDMDMELEEGELMEGDESAGENVEGEGEAPGASEKKFYQYSRDELLGLSKKLNKAHIESLPSDLIKSKQTSPQNQNYGNRGGQQMNRMMSMNKGGGGGGGGMRNNWMGTLIVPPPPPQKHPPPRVIEIMSEKVELHKAEKAWKPKLPGRGGGRDMNDEIVNQTRGILNKLTPDNFDKLVDKFMKLPLEDNDERISSVIRVVFDKAVDEPSFSAAYAKMVNKICNQSQETSKIFRKKILDQCQKEFQKNSSDEDEIKEAELELENAEESKKEILKIELEEKKNQMRRRSLGNVRFIGELYKLGMLTPKIMMECVGMLLCMDEEKLECLCKLLTTVGQKLEEQIRDLEAMIAQKKKRGGDVKFEPEARWFDKTFAKLKELSRTEALSLRIRFALEDVHELRLNNWKPRRDTNAPKTIDEVRRDAARQDQEEKRLISTLPLSNLPPQRRGDVKKPTDWNVVSSNKSSRFQQQQQTPGKRGDAASSGQSSPVLGPPATQWGKFGPQPPFGKVSQPPSNVPPRYQPGRFGLLDNEDKRTPAPPPSRDDIVKPLPTSNNKNAQPPLPTSNIPPLFGNRTPPMGRAKNQSPPTPLLNATSSSNERHSPPSPAGKPEMDPSQNVKNISKEFFFSKNFDDTIDWIQEKFPGEEVGTFIDMFSNKIADNSKGEQQKLAGTLVKNLLSRRLVSKEKVLNILSLGVIRDLPDIEVDAPMAVSYLAVFLGEIFCEEKDILWLQVLGDALEKEFEDTSTKLVTNVIKILEEKLGKETVGGYLKGVPSISSQLERRLRENSEESEIPISDREATEEVNSEAKQVDRNSPVFRIESIIPVLDENESNILTSLKDMNMSSDNCHILTEAICIFSWDKEGKNWDADKLRKLLPILSKFTKPEAQAQRDLWLKVIECLKRNEIEEKELWPLWNETFKTTESTETG